MPDIRSPAQDARAARKKGFGQSPSPSQTKALLAGSAVPGTGLFLLPEAQGTTC